MSANTTSTEPAAHTREEYVPLIPLTYTGPVPHPHAACTDPTPDEQMKATLRSREEQLRQRESDQLAKDAARATGGPEERQSAPAAGPQGIAAEAVQQLKEGATGAIDGVRSLLSQLSLTVEKASNDVTVKALTQAHAADQQQSHDRFSAYFGEELVKGQGEVLLADYSCSAMHNGVQVSGHLFITRNYICFAGNFGSVFANATDKLRQVVRSDAATGEMAAKVVGVKQVIPLKTVASIVRSCALPTEGNGAPYFLPCPAEHVIATALQVYVTGENKLYQFLKFDSMAAKVGAVFTTAIKGTPLDRAYNYLDHAWREAVTVPLEGVHYA